MTGFGGQAEFTPPWWPTDQCVSNCSFVSGEVSGTTAAAIGLIIALGLWRDRLSPAVYRLLVAAALALAVWVVGLNLYATREATQGQRLKAQMSQRVKQAFPELPVILNPLQQARQQIAARQSGTPAKAGRRERGKRMKSRSKRA